MATKEIELKEKFEKFYKIVDNNFNSKFRVTYNNGSKAILRLYITISGGICYKQKKNLYWALPIYEIKDIEVIPQPKQKSGIELCRHNLNLIVKYLTESGFWEEKLNGAKWLLSLTDYQLELLKDYKEYQEHIRLLPEKVQWFGCDCLCALFEKKIKTIPFLTDEREWREKQIKSAIENRENIKGSWRGSYDYSFEINFDKERNTIKGWYSEEYQGCGNGHYYYLLDNKHVIFGEDD